MPRGLLIIFEGANGSGKTSLINKITEELNNIPVIINKDGKEDKLWNVYKFPNRETPIGKKIDEFLKNKLTLTKETELKFFADNRKEYQLKILNLLKSGYNVICDRYVYSSLAYTLTNQTLSIKNSEHINILSVDNILKYDSNLIKPDYVFLIRGDHLKLRNEEAQKYHKDGVFNDLLLNNYLISFTHTKVKYMIIENVFGKLDETVDIIIDKIESIDEDRKDNGIFDNIINKF
jgi:thymidylate kinase